MCRFRAETLRASTFPWVARLRILLLLTCPPTYRAGPAQQAGRAKEGGQEKQSASRPAQLDEYNKVGAGPSVTETHALVRFDGPAEPRHDLIRDTMAATNPTLHPSTAIEVLKLQQSAAAVERRSTLVHLNLEERPATGQATFNVFYFVEKAQSDQFPNAWPLNVESWLLHLRTKTTRPKVVQLNDANVKDYIPDLPSDFDSLPYAQAKSDFVRYAVLFFHGGMYMDSDVVFQKPLDPEVPERIVSGGVELFAYESGGQNCVGDPKVKGGAPSFSSNIIGASRGSSYMRRVWEKQKQEVSDHCKTAAEFATEARICCPALLSVPGAQTLYDKSGRPITKCHVPWTRLGEGTSHKVSLVPAAAEFTATFRPTAVKAAHVTQFNAEGGGLVVCYRGDENFAPHYANILAAQIGSAEHDHAVKETPNLLGRAAYHQFNSNGHVDIKRRSCEDLVDENFVLGRIFAQALFGGSGVDKQVVERICERKEAVAEVLEGSTILNEVAPPVPKPNVVEAGGGSPRKDEPTHAPAKPKVVEAGGGAPPNDASALAVPKPKMVEAGGGVPPKDGLARTVFKPKKEKRTDRRAAQSGTIAMQIAVSIMVVGVLLLLAASSRAFWRYSGEAPPPTSKLFDAENGTYGATS